MEGRLPGEELVEDAGEREDVAAAVDLLVAAGLLGAHVGRGAHHHAGRGQLLVHLAHRARDAEVGHQHPIVLEHDVVGLDVPVDDALLVRVGERRGDRAADADHLLGGEGAFLLEPLPDVLTLDEGHGEPEQLERCAAGGQRYRRDAGVEDAEDVGVLEARGDADLAAEPVGAEGGAELGVEELEGDGFAGAVVGEKDGGHAPVAELALDGVRAGQGGLEVSDEFCFQLATPG